MCGELKAQIQYMSWDEEERSFESFISYCRLLSPPIVPIQYIYNGAELNGVVYIVTKKV